MYAIRLDIRPSNNTKLVHTVVVMTTRYPHCRLTSIDLLPSNCACESEDLSSVDLGLPRSCRMGSALIIIWFVCVFVCVCMCVLVHVCVCTCMYLCVHVCICVYMCCVYVCCVCVHMRVRVCMV